jgi:hypothetical protein
MISVDLFLEMRDLCRTCSEDGRVSEYQNFDLMADAAFIARMEQGERLYWFAFKNGTHFNNYLQTLERVQKFYTDPVFESAFTPIYIIDCVSDDDYEFYPLSDLYN